MRRFAHSMLVAIIAGLLATTSASAQTDLLAEPLAALEHVSKEVEKIAQTIKSAQAACDQHRDAAMCHADHTIAILTLTNVGVNLTYARIAAVSGSKEEFNLRADAVIKAFGDAGSSLENLQKKYSPK